MMPAEFFLLACGVKRAPIAGMKRLPHTRSCFVCGQANPLGLKLRFETDGQIVQARFTPRPEHVGFKQVIHGGIIATVLDEIMVWVCAVRARRFAYCAEMSVRFVKPLRPGAEAVATAALTANRRDRMFEAAAKLNGAAGDLLASASGKYLPMREADVAEMATDFVEDPRWIFGG